MKKGFYSKLAWTGIRKNKRLYTPYILTCIGMVMMFYIICFLSTSSVLETLPGGATMQSMLSFGGGVMGVFSLIFLFYTNSFLIRRRKKEFGLYNILGMGKWNLGRVLFWETLIIAVIALAVGLFAGIVLSKLAELGMVNILRTQATFALSLEPLAIRDSVILFGIIFLLLFLNGLRQIHLSNPIELLHSENSGEKPPKANWFFAVAGLLLLGAAYYLAITIEDPITALVWFFVAVVMVIIATYLLFVSGSVAFCRLLQKKKNYYYKTNHFVSISSMVYRMKRNGAGLASICILCTMVLVMLSSTVCLYIGTEDTLQNRYPRHMNVDISTGDPANLSSEITDEVRRTAQQITEDEGLEPENLLDYQMAAFAGTLEDDRFIVTESTMYDYASVWQVFVVSLEDYNRLMGENETLEPGQALVYTTKTPYEGDTIAIEDSQPLTIKKQVSDFQDNGIDTSQIFSSMYIFVPDVEEVVRPLMGRTISDSSTISIVEFHWFYGYDIEAQDDAQIQVWNRLDQALEPLSESQEQLNVLVEGRAQERSSFYGLYGGLFFLGILLGIVFVFAAVLIMYYKQISEGYEDQSRFEIMQKVGMTKKEIRKSVNSQVLTVFFLPLLAAGVHLAFAFPLIYRLLILFSLTNLHLLILVTVCAYLVFALFYVLVYRITSGAYYHIVSGTAKEE